MTREMPFTVSPAAEAHLGDVLRYVAETVPDTSYMVPALCRRGKSVTTWAWRGASPMPEYSDEEYSIVYHRLDQVAEWPRVRVAGADLAIAPETLEKMQGLQLMLTEATEGESLSGRIVGRRY